MRCNGALADDDTRSELRNGATVFGRVNALLITKHRRVTCLSNIDIMVLLQTL